MASSSSVWSAPLRPLGRMGGGLLDRVLCVVGAVSLSQAPEFFQQYLQRIGGHLDEARRVLAGYETVARQSGLTLQQLIDTTRAQASEPVAKLGGLIADAQARVDELGAAELALRTANLWERPFVFLRHVETDIARATWEVFKPAVPVTLEGAVYAGVGMVLALMLYQLLIAAPVRAVARRRAARRGTPGASAASAAARGEVRS